MEGRGGGGVCGDAWDSEAAGKRNKAPELWDVGRDAQWGPGWQLLASSRGGCTRRNSTPTIDYCPSLLCPAVGELQAAFADFSRLIELDPRAVEAVYCRGTVSHKMGHIDAAITDFSRALELDPNHIQAAYSRAACNNLAGRYDEAIGGCCLRALGGGRLPLSWLLHCRISYFALLNQAHLGSSWVVGNAFPPAEDYGQALAKDQGRARERRRPAGGASRSRPGSSGGRSLPDIGNMCWTTRCSPRPRTLSGAAAA